MKQKYNIALIPSDESELFIQFARNIARNMPADRYSLGERSLPHISLCHFEADSEQVEEIWEKVKDLDFPTLSLIFDQQRNKSFPGHPKDGGVCWVSLISDQLDELKEMHLQVAEIIKKPLNGAYENYDPHMTLLNSRLEDENLAINRYEVIHPILQADFNVALGKLDNVGQITEILYHSDPKPTYGM